MRCNLTLEEKAVAYNPWNGSKKVETWAKMVLVEVIYCSVI